MPENKIQKIVAPVKGYQDKVWWMNIGISGVKEDGKRWVRINTVPLGWDGYAILVDDDKDDHEKGKARKAKPTSRPDDGPDTGGIEEVPF